MNTRCHDRSEYSWCDRKIVARSEDLSDLEFILDGQRILHQDVVGTDGSSALSHGLVVHIVVFDPDELANVLPLEQTPQG
ncbi:MAG: hypothetical protein KGR25_06205, partial [Chloroflexi bacterium]|nr:hypothetical protein [Chloroflexota bacterium]